ncbi:MAG: O-antigen ligase family protein [Chitinophagales bacterium]|nr:O-antigen ligase family protein [Chitinophagales bacterium]
MPDLHIKHTFDKNIIFTASAILLASVVCAILANEILFCLIPIAFLVTFQLLINFRPLFYILLITTPAALEYSFAGGFSTDLPTEPLQIILMFTFLFYVILRKERIDKNFLQHPVTILLAIHFLWICITTIFSTDILVSLKYVLAKAWYIVTFYFITSFIIKSVKEFKTAFWCLLIPTFILVIYTLYNHYLYAWSFSDVNKTMFPWFRNHVNYAVFLALMFPFLILAITWYKKYSWQKIFLKLSVVIFLFAIYFSYTRSSWLSLIAAGFCFVLMKINWLRGGVSIAIICAIGFVIYMLHDNTYLDYAPDFKKTIYHSNFEDHMASTATLEDVSSAERIYRWIAATKMIEDKPVTGFGPAQFYDNYKEYTVNKFLTYISKNEEKSTVHNYYLQITVEQGFTGLAIWIILLITVLFYGQNIYNRAIDKEDKYFVMAITLSFITILVNISLSDLIEANKIGTLFFMNMALIVNMDLYIRKKLKAADEHPLESV